MFDRVVRGAIDMWDTQPVVACRAQKALSIVPSWIPVSNIGFRSVTIHTSDPGLALATTPTFPREAQLLILGEPTAALDAHAGCRMFVRFDQLMGGRMAMVTSHRFPTVRMPDGIVLLGEGRMLEEGTHEELLEREGFDAELFEMQAAGCR